MSEKNEEQRQDWNRRADDWARREEWVNRMMAPVAQPLLDLASQGMRVLDVGTGSGQPALSVAPLVAPDGSVVAIDLSAEMLANARKNAERLGATNVRFQEMDGEEIDFPPASFDLALARCSLMFMADPLSALQRIRAALVPGGRFGCLVWAAADRNPWATISERLAVQVFELPGPAPGAPSMFALGEAGKLASLLEGAGFQDVSTRDLQSTFVYDDAETLWEVRGQYTLGRQSGEKPQDKVDQFRRRLLQEAAPYRDAEGHYNFLAMATFGSGRA